MNCKRCGSSMNKNGTVGKNGARIQKYKCKKCGYEMRELNEVLVMEEPAQKQSGLTEEQFRAKFDLTFIVKKKCLDLQKGIFLSMGEFIKTCGIMPGSGYRQILDHPDFENYRGRVRGDTYWSHPESISKMKTEGILM